MGTNFFNYFDSWALNTQSANEHISVGCKDYQLAGTYSYTDVCELNALTLHNADFGWCKELGPIAFIGIPNHNCIGHDGYFEYTIPESEEADKKEQFNEYFFHAYTLQEAQKITNYTVYGMISDIDCFKIIQENAKIAKLSWVYKK